MSEQLTIAFALALTSNFEEPEGPNGPLIVHNVPIMVAGRWKSMQGKTCEFTDQDLDANKDNWMDNAVWTRHQLLPGENRSAELCIGGVTKRYFTPNFSTVLEDGTIYKGAAILGDVLLHRKTDASRDAAVLIRLPKGQGGFRMTSAEIAMLDENFDVKTGVYHPKKYAFGGLTIQREGACNACNIPAFASAAPGQRGMDMAEPKPAETPPVNQAPPAPGGAEAEPAWATEMKGLLHQILEREMQEAAAKGAAKGAKPSEPPADGAKANECKAGMAAPQITTEQFAAMTAELATLKEDRRKLQAIVDKANSKPESTRTAGADFAAGEKLNTEGISTSSMMLVGKNLHISGRD